MDPVTLALVAVGGGTAAALGFWRRRSARRFWEAFATELGLHVERDPRLRQWQIWGLWRQVPVRIQPRGRAAAIITAFFRVPAPEGLILRGRFGGGPRPGPEARPCLVGHEGLDDFLRAWALRPARARSWLENPVVHSTLSALLQKGWLHGLSEEGLSGAFGGSMVHRVAIREGLDDLVDAVVRMEQGLAWRPPPVASEGDPLPPDPASVEPEPVATGEPWPATAPAPLAGGATMDQLLADLTAAGRVESAGEFTLDRDTARKKLQRFQLGEPTAFLWLILRAAIARGARRIQIQRGSELRLSFDGAPITRGEADRCWSALFAVDDSAAGAALRLLGLGLNGALAGGEGEVRVCSGRGADGIDWRIPGRGRDAVQTRAPEDGRTEIRVLGPLVEGLRDAALADAARARLRFAPVTLELSLDGKPVPTGGLEPPGARGRVPLQGAGWSGAVGFSGDAVDEGRIHVVMDGVFMETVTDSNLLPGLEAVVSAAGLEVDLSQRRVVRGDAWRRVVRDVLDAQREALGAFVLASFPGGTLPQDGARDAEAIARACLGHAPTPLPTEAPWSALASLPLFPTIDGGRASLADLGRWREEDAELRHAGVTLERACLDAQTVREAVGEPARILLLAWPMRAAEGAALAHLAAGALRDVTPALLRLERVEAAVRERVLGPASPRGRG